jgi:ABC-type multidrug transport system fused ATPase/permease subunit
LSDFSYTKDIRVDALSDSPLIEGEEQDRLSSLSLFNIATRTWPYIRPEIKHLSALTLTFLLLILLGIVTIGLLTDIFYNHLINGDPLTDRLMFVLNLEGREYLDVEKLSDEARQDVRAGMFRFASLVAVFGIPSMFGALFYYMWIRQRINQNLRVRMMHQVQALSLRFHANTQSGDAIYRVYQDSAMVTNIIQLLLDAIRDIFVFSIAVITLYLFSPQLAGMLLMITISLGLLCGLMSSPMRVGFRGARETNSRLTSRIQISVAGIKVVKANGAERDEYQRFQQEQRRAFSAAYDARSRWSRFGIYNFTIFAVGLLVGESYMALLSALGVETYSTATVFTVSIGFTLWNLGAFRFAVGRMGDSGIQSLLLRWGRFQEMSVGLDRAFEILDLEPEVTDAADAIEMIDIVPEVSFQQICFSYEKTKATLTDINLSVEPGSVTAIVGPTGSGKSTLMSLLLRLFDPDAGTIRVGGRDIREFTVDSLRTNIAIALQENILFSASIRENIRYAVPGATDQQVYAAAQIAEADTFSLAQPYGYDTELGERGAKLSTGQRQRISIARAVLKDAPILILDEPTAALDAQTESKVMQNLSEWGRQRVIFLITHRLSTIRQADHIIYLRDGSIVETGTHEELATKKQGAYSRFVALEESLMNTNSTEKRTLS